MRRLVKHGIAGVAFAAFTVTTAVAALGSPAGLDTAIAIPAPLVSITPSATPAASNPALPAEAAARGERESREATRAQLTAAAALQASKRATTLSKQVAAVTAQQQQIKAEQAKAKAAQAKARVKARAAQAKAEAAQAKAAAEAKAKAEVAAKAAAAAAKAAAAAQERVIKNRGYEPGTTDPRSMAKQILANKYNYGADQYSCFNYIIMRESMWKVTARNSSSGAYGIPQALPGSKMATVASDWRTNPATQIIWGIEYMKDRYGSPCAAKGFKASHGWY